MDDVKYIDDEIEDLASKINKGEQDIADVDWVSFLSFNMSVLKGLLCLIKSNKNRIDIIDCTIKRCGFFHKLHPELPTTYSHFGEDCQELKRLIVDADDFDITLAGRDVASLRSQNNAPQKKSNAQTKLMDIEGFKDLIQMFVEKEFVDVIGKNSLGEDIYKWRQKNQLAYFAELVSDKLPWPKRKNGDKTQTNWKPFERLFKENNLRLVRHDYAKNSSKPTRANEIEQLIEGWCACFQAK